MNLIFCHWIVHLSSQGGNFQSRTVFYSRISSRPRKYISLSGRKIPNIPTQKDFREVQFYPCCYINFKLCTFAKHIWKLVNNKHIIQHIQYTENDKNVPENLRTFPGNACWCCFPEYVHTGQVKLRETSPTYTFT